MSVRFIDPTTAAIRTEWEIIQSLPHVCFGALGSNPPDVFEPHGYRPIVESSPPELGGFVAEQDGVEDVGGEWRTRWRLVPAPVPRSVTRLQALAALDGAQLLDDIEAWVAQPDTPRIVRLAWQNAQSFERDSPTLRYIATVFALTDEQLDRLFVAAHRIEV